LLSTKLIQCGNMIGHFKSPSIIEKVLNAGGACKKNINNNKEGVAVY
jgi:hypothetical protein